MLQHKKLAFLEIGQVVQPQATSTLREMRKVEIKIGKTRARTRRKRVWKKIRRIEPKMIAGCTVNQTSQVPKTMQMRNNLKISVSITKGIIVKTDVKDEVKQRDDFEIRPRGLIGSSSKAEDIPSKITTSRDHVVAIIQVEAVDSNCGITGTSQGLAVNDLRELDAISRRGNPRRRSSNR